MYISYTSTTLAWSYQWIWMINDIIVSHIFILIYINIIIILCRNIIIIYYIDIIIICKFLFFHQTNSAYFLLSFIIILQLRKTTII